MGDQRSFRPASDDLRAAGTAFLQRLVTGSLILFVVGNVAQRAWVLLNSDVGQLVRRLH